MYIINTHKQTWYEQLLTKQIYLYSNSGINHTIKYNNNTNIVNTNKIKPKTLEDAEDRTPGLTHAKHTLYH